MNENVAQLIVDLLVICLFWIPFIVLLVMVGARDRKPKVKK